ncbi:MAG: aspartate kinase [SAR202 cluster bacterium]|nr:aspartate kinase [Chloroflexota bacterium]MQG39582.1 aspartate kinase [SAR202 cluster bacterium]|tara:strand:- start:9664 stop:10893 length:1230 start_codon:yes stop_codon:yes gene_type:complete
MNLVVQKYGGSSLASAEAIKNIAKKIKFKIDKGEKIVCVVSAMGETTDNLINLALNITDNPDSRELDLLLSTGELVSSTLLTIALRSMDIKAISLTGTQAGIFTNKSHGNAKILSIDSSRIWDELNRNKVVVIAGFQGFNDSMDITTLGRGGSDTTAVAIAAELNADICEIYTDVDGIFTANPKYVPNATKLDSVEYEEMLELASLGAKMHPRSIELGLVYKMPILVASSVNDVPGTMITQGDNKLSNKTVGEVRNRVRGIATDENISRITIHGLNNIPGTATKIFEPLSLADISVDVIVQNSGNDGQTNISFTIKDSELTKTKTIMEKICSHIDNASFTYDTGLSKISIVGTGMQDAPGYATQMFKSLSDANINIEMITTSEIRITCIIKQENTGEAARILHSSFDLD